MEDETKDSIDIIEVDEAEFESTCFFDMCANGG